MIGDLMIRMVISVVGMREEIREEESDLFPKWECSLSKENRFGIHIRIPRRIFKIMKKISLLLLVFYKHLNVFSLTKPPIFAFIHISEELLQMNIIISSIPVNDSAIDDPYVSRASGNSSIHPQ